MLGTGKQCDYFIMYKRTWTLMHYLQLQALFMSDDVSIIRRARADAVRA